MGNILEGIDIDIVHPGIDAVEYAKRHPYKVAGTALSIAAPPLVSLAAAHVTAAAAHVTAAAALNIAARFPWIVSKAGAVLQANNAIRPVVSIAGSILSRSYWVYV